MLRLQDALEIDRKDDTEKHRSECVCEREKEKEREVAYSFRTQTKHPGNKVHIPFLLSFISLFVCMELNWRIYVN